MSIKCAHNKHPQTLKTPELEERRDEVGEERGEERSGEGRRDNVGEGRRGDERRGRRHEVCIS